MIVTQNPESWIMKVYNAVFENITPILLQFSFKIYFILITIFRHTSQFDGITWHNYGSGIQSAVI